MPDNMIFEEIFVDKLASSTETEGKENPRFRLSFMVYNEYGVQLVSELGNGKIIHDLYEEDSATKKMFANELKRQEHCLYGAGSIKGETLDKFLIKRVKMQQVGFQNQPQQQSMLGKWFGGDSAGKKNEGAF